MKAHPIWRRLALASATSLLACFSPSCGGNSTGGPQLAWVWPLAQRTADRGGSAQANGPTVGSVAWSVSLDAAGFGLIVTESDLILVRTGKDVSAYQNDGSFVWKRTCGASEATAMALPAQLAFVPTDDGTLVGLTRKGATGFSQVVEGRLTSPAYRHDKDIVVAHAASATEGRVSILSPQAGPPIGSVAIGVVGLGSAAVDANDHAYVGSPDGKLYAVDLREGLMAPVAAFNLDLGKPCSRGTPSTRDGIVFVVDDADRLHALSDTGAPFWIFTPDVTTDQGGGSTPALHPSNLVIYGTRDEHVYALRHDGSVAWKFDCGAPVTAPAVIDGSGRVYVRADGGLVFALDAKGHLLFSVSLVDTTGGFDSSLALGSDGSLYVTTHDGRLICIRDTPAWQQVGRDASHSSRTSELGPQRALTDVTLALAKSLAGPVLVGTDGRLVARAQNGTLIAVAADGSPIFERNPGAGDSAPALLRSDAVVAGTDQGELVGYDARGQTLFRTSLGAKVGSATISPAGNIVVACADGVVHSVSATGNLLASASVGKPELAPPAVGGDSSITLALLNGDVVRIGSDGQVKFRTAVGAHVQNPVVLAGNGDALVLTDDDVLIAIDSNGKSRWFFDPGVPGAGRGPAIAADQSIVFGDASGKLHILDATGRETLAFALDGPPTGAPAIDADGRLYVTTTTISAFAADGTLLFRRAPPPGASAELAAGPTLGRGGELIVAESAGFVVLLTDRAPWPAHGGKSDRAGFSELPGPRAPTIGFSAPAGSDVSASATIAGDGRIYVKSESGELIALTAAGAELWRTGVGTGKIAPLLTSDGRIVGASDQGRLTQLDRGGRVRWFLELGEPLTSPLEALDGTILVGGRQTIFRASAAGELLDSLPMPSLNEGAIALSASGLVAVATAKRSIVIFPMNDPDTRTTIKTPVPLTRGTPVWDRSERVYVLNDQDQLACYSKTGTLIYLASPGLTTNAGGRGGPAVEIDQVALFSAQDGKIYRVDLQGGIQSIYQAAGPLSAPPLIDGEGVVFGAAGGLLFGITQSGSEVFPPVLLDASAGELGSPAISLQGDLVIGGANGTIYQVGD
jgi:outer membrane protein assembly factor BamB